MTMITDRELTLVEQAEADPVLALEMAAAGGSIEGAALLVRVFAQTGLSQRELARRAGVTEGRVSQVLSGEENLRLATVARYLEVMGYTLNLSAINKETGAVVEARQRRKPRMVEAWSDDSARTYASATG